MGTGWYGVSTTGVPYGTWFHMAFVYLGPCQGAIAYQDGVQDGSDLNPSGVSGYKYKLRACMVKLVSLLLHW